MNKLEEIALLNVYLRVSYITCLDVDIVVDISKGKKHSKAALSFAWWDPPRHFYDTSKILSVPLNKLVKLSEEEQRDIIRYLIVKCLNTRTNFTMGTQINIKPDVDFSVNLMLYKAKLHKDWPAKMSITYELINRWQQGWWRELL